MVKCFNLQIPDLAPNPLNHWGKKGWVQGIFPILLSLLATSLPACKKKGGSALAPSIQLPFATRSFEIGCQPAAKEPIGEEETLEAFKLLGENAEFVLVHANVAWAEFQNGIVEEDIKIFRDLDIVSFLAEQEGIKVFIVIDPLSQNRKEIDPDLPPTVGSNFGDSGVRDAFRNFSVRVARDYQPPYLGLASEINTYFTSMNHPEDKDNFLSLYQETYDAVKMVSPDTLITATFQYESMTGTLGTEHFSLLGDFENVSSLDLVAISTYPSPWFSDPDLIPSDYYLQLRDHTERDIIIAESGWPSGGDASFNGSTDKQNRFLVRFLELTDGLNVRLWIWWFLHDWERDPLPSFFQTMGLRTSAGDPKPSWDTWKAIHALPGI